MWLRDAVHDSWKERLSGLNTSFQKAQRISLSKKETLKKKKRLKKKKVGNASFVSPKQRYL